MFAGASDPRRSVTIALLRLTSFAVPLAFTTLTFSQFLLPQALLLRVLTAATVASALLWLGTAGTGGWRRSIDLPVIAFGAVLLLGTAWSVSPGLSWRGEYGNLDGTLIQLQGLLLFFVTTQAVNRLRERALVIEAIVLAGLIEAAYVLIQASGLEFAISDMSFVSVGRFDGTSGNPLIAGAVLATVLPLAAVLLLSAEGSALRRRAIATGVALIGGSAVWIGLAAASLGVEPCLDQLRASASRPAPWALAGGLACAALQVAAALWGRLPLARGSALAGVSVVLVRALTETGSRSALLAALVALPSAALAAWWVSRREAGSGSISGPRRKTVAAAALVLLGLLAASAVTSSSARTFGGLLAPIDAIAESRSNIWGPALAMWRERPITGWGVDTFMRVVPGFETPFRPPDLGELQVPQNAHSEILMLLATVGLTGCAAWLAVVGFWCASAVRRLRADDGEARWLQVGCIAGVLVLLVYGLTGISSPSLRAVFWVLLGVSVTTRPGTPWTMGVPALARGIAAGVLVIVSLVTAAQAFRADIFYKAAVVAARGLDAARWAPPDRALATGEEALANAPSSDDWLEAQRVELAAARIDLERSLREREPQSARAASRFAGLSLCLQAVALQSRAVAFAPREPQYLWYLGEMLSLRYGTFPEDDSRQAWFLRAKQAYETAIERSGLDGFATASLARLHFQRWRVESDPAAADEARRLYADALRQAPLVRPILRDAVAVEFALGRPEAGIAVISALSRRAPELAVEILQPHVAVPGICAEEREAACRGIVRRALDRNPHGEPAGSVARVMGW